MKIIYSNPNKQLSKQQASNVIHSIGKAHEIGLPLNRFATINLDQISNGNYRILLDRFIKNYRADCKRNSIKPAFVWVLENRTVGVHVHFLFHYPSATHRPIDKLKKKMKNNWLNGIEGIELNKCDGWIHNNSIRSGSTKNSHELLASLELLSEAIEKGSEAPQKVGKQIISNRRIRTDEANEYDGVIKIAAYLCKGVERGSQGAIYGRRMGRSRNLI